MDIKEFIESGIIELYCTGAATSAETAQVEMLAAENEEVRNEIEAVNEALQLYAAASAKSPAFLLKSKILNAVFAVDNSSHEIPFPPSLLDNAVAEFWLKYLVDNNIGPGENFSRIHLVNLPGKAQQETYVAWAEKGVTHEEVHEDAAEYMLMVKGRCSFTMEGKTTYHKEGDLIFIPKNVVHKAEVLSDGIMILVGQRIAA